MKQNGHNPQLTDYKSLIDADIAEHSQLLLERWQRDFGLEAAQIFDAYLSVLSRGGKRLRGALVMWAHKRAGGSDEELALRGARLIEMIHAYLLVVDDIADEASTRRGDVAAHKMLEAYHVEQNRIGDSAHFGEMQAMNAALAAQHIVMQELAELPAPDSVKLEAIRELNITLTRTLAGQITDISFETLSDVQEHEVITMMSQKTAHYSFVNPLQIGVILAGGDWSQQKWLEKWALSIGLSFQLQDDILGVFGDNKKTGKSNLDDLAEGKRTLLVVRALTHANETQKKQLLTILGKRGIGEAELEVARAIFKDTGALDYVQTLSKNYAKAAIEALDGQLEASFLEELSHALTNRQV